MLSTGHQDHNHGTLRQRCPERVLLAFWAATETKRMRCLVGTVESLRGLFSLPFLSTSCVVQVVGRCPHPYINCDNLWIASLPPPRSIARDGCRSVVLLAGAGGGGVH